MFCILVSNLVFRGTIPFDKTRQKTVGFGLHGRSAADVGNPRGSGWSGQAWHTPTRPGLSGVAGQNRTGLGDLSVGGSGAKGSGVQETLQNPRHILRASDRTTAITTLATALPNAPCPATLRLHFAEGHRAMIGTSAGRPEWHRITCFNRLGPRQPAKRDEGSGHASILHQGLNLTPNDRCD